MNSRANFAYLYILLSSEFLNQSLDRCSIPSREVSILWSYLDITLLFSSYVYLIFSSGNFHGLTIVPAFLGITVILFQTAFLLLRKHQSFFGHNIFLAASRPLSVSLQEKSVSGSLLLLREWDWWTVIPCLDKHCLESYCKKTSRSSNSLSQHYELGSCGKASSLFLEVSSNKEWDS